jgi:hypothetical protein
MRCARFPGAAGMVVLLALLSGGVSAGTTETTALEGDVPTALAGRWLVVEQNRLPTGLVVPFARLWEIRQGPEHLELLVRRARLPETLGTKLAAAATANRPWTPDGEDLRELAERWDDLPPATTGPQQIVHRLVGPDARPRGVQPDGVTAVTGVVIVTEERFTPASPVKARRSVYTVRDGTAARLVGTFVSDSTAETPAPVSIALKGDFQAHRVPVVLPPSRLRRLLDAVLGRHEPS